MDSKGPERPVRRVSAQAQPVSERGFIRALGLFPATALNMAQVVGIGPFITIPLIIAAIGGPPAPPPPPCRRPRPTRCPCSLFFVCPPCCPATCSSHIFLATSLSL